MKQKAEQYTIRNGKQDQTKLKITLDSGKTA